MIANKIPELTDEESAVISEYAADTLLKYDTNHKKKLGGEPEGFINPADVTPTPSPTPTPTPEIEEAKQEGTTDSGVTVVDNTPQAVMFTELEDIFGLSSEVDFTLDGYEVVDTYPDTTDAYFVMSASEGCDFIIIKFRVDNITGNTVHLDIPQQSVRFKVKLNGETKNALTTLLLNDIISYKEDLEPGESDDVVVVAEFDDAALSNIESLSLIVKKDDGNAEIVIR